MSKKKWTHPDPINELPESVYISSALRMNFDPRDQSPKYDEALSMAYGSHMANAYRESLGFARSHSFILGYMRHQQNITNPESKFIKVDEVDSVHIIERKDRKGNVLGHKVQLDFLSHNSKKGKSAVESIATGWIDYFGYGDTVFEISLSRSLAATLAVLRDMNVDFKVRKVLLDFTENAKGNQIRPRELGDVSPIGGAERDAAVIAQNLDALTIAIEESTAEAIAFLEDEDLYDEYYDRAFGFVA